MEDLIAEATLKYLSSSISTLQAVFFGFKISVASYFPTYLFRFPSVEDLFITII